MSRQISLRNNPSSNLSISEDILIGLATYGSTVGAAKAISMLSSRIVIKNAAEEAKKENDRAKQAKIGTDAKDKVKLIDNIAWYGLGGLAATLGAITLIKDDNKDVGIPVIVGGLSTVITKFVENSLLKED